MSQYPATLGDLADVEARLDDLIKTLRRKQGEDSGVTDEKFASIRQKVASLQDWRNTGELDIARLYERVEALERLWAVALENPDLIRELAAQALRGREPG